MRSLIHHKSLGFVLTLLSIVTCAVAAQALLTLPACQIAPAGVISWWPAENNAQDIVSHYDGTLQNGATFASGLVGQAFSLDGLDDAIVVNNNLALNPTSITVEAWVKPDSVPVGTLKDVVTKWGFDAAVDSYLLGLLNNGSGIRVIGGIGDGATGDPGLLGGTVSLNTWSHIAMTYDAASGLHRLYLNGAQVNQRVRANGIYATTSRVFIGREDSNQNRFFSGLIDEPTIYSRALTDAEILAIYNAGSNGKCSASSTPTPTPTPSPSPSPSPAANVVQFSASNYDVQEDCTTVTITVNRIGDTSGAASVDYNTSDGTASERRDYTTALGKLQFAPGETSKLFVVLVNEDSYAEGSETFNLNLSNPSGATLGGPAIATVTITDDATEPAANPIDDTRNYVCQHYHDFLNRQPDQGGWDFWTNQITACGSDPACLEASRISVSASFFLSIEFQNTGYLVERLYKVSYGNAIGSSSVGGAHQLTVPIVRFNEFLLDTQQISRGVIVGPGNWELILEQNKQAFTAEFVQRARFTTALPTSLTPTQFVNQLFANAAVTPSDADRNVAIAEFGGALNTNDAPARARALRRVAENSILTQQEFNRAFVLMQYFGYLRRNPNDPQDTDYSGYDFWLTKLDQFNGNYLNAEMVKAFITSFEYRERFAPRPVGQPGELTPEQRVAAVEMVRAKIESLTATGASKNEVNQQLLAFIRSLPEFADAGISSDSCVWAKYIDGAYLIVTNNLDPPPPHSVSRPGVAASARPNVKPKNLPDSIKARLLWALGPAFTDNPVPDIRAWLNEQNYTEPINEGATIEALKTVGGDGVLYLDGHGGPAEGPAPFSVGSETLVSPIKEREWDSDLKPSPNCQGCAPRLVHNVGVYDTTIIGRQTYAATYGITSQFVQDYWSNFSSNSFVFIAGCNGASSNAAAFRAALKNKHVSVYAGWTKEVHSGVSEDTARFVFDRLLGANKVHAESDGFKQRPFTYESVAQDFQYHGVGKDLTNGSELVFLSLDPSQGGFQLLAPSIREMVVNEATKELVLVGEFGEDPGENSRAVFVGGQQVHVKANSWTGFSIICDLPDSGDGAAGEVLVTVRQQKSNAAMLSEWQGSFTHTATGDGTLKQTATYNVRWRGDLRKVHYEIHEPPSIDSNFRGLGNTEDSTCVFACTGSHTSGNTTEEWSGSGTLRPRSSNGTFFTSGWVKDDRTLSMIFEIGGSLRVVTIKTTNGGSTTTNESLITVRVVPSNDGVIDFALDGNGNIIADTLTRTDPGTGYVHKLTWSTIQIKNPPNPNSPR